MANTQLSNVGLFVPTNFTWDINLIHSTDINSDEFKELLIRLYQNINSMCIALNLKDSAYYIQSEFLNGQAFFPNPNSTASVPSERQAFRTVVNFGVLPNATSISIPHNIDVTDTFIFTRIYATASDQLLLQYIPIPYASATGTDNIQIDVDATNVTITTASDYSAYTICYVILEYVKE